jgi:hypothetical protein
MDNMFYYNIRWDTSLTSEREAGHTVHIELHNCAAALRDSIQIPLPQDATLTEELSAECVDDKNVNILPGYMPSSGTYSISLSELRRQSSLNDLTIKISLREKGSISNIHEIKKQAYSFKFGRITPQATHFEYNLSLPPYRHEIVRKLANVLAHAIRKPGAYNITPLNIKPEHVDAMRGIITYRFGGSHRFIGPAAPLVVIYNKALQPDTWSMVFGFVVGFGASLLANWIFRILTTKGT